MYSHIAWILLTVFEKGNFLSIKQGLLVRFVAHRFYYTQYPNKLGDAT